jgi:hypothetical protein
MWLTIVIWAKTVWPAIRRSAAMLVRAVRAATRGVGHLVARGLAWARMMAEGLLAIIVAFALYAAFVAQRTARFVALHVWPAWRRHGAGSPLDPSRSALRPMPVAIR